MNYQQKTDMDEGIAAWSPRFQERCNPFDPSIRGLKDMTNAPIQRGLKADVRRRISPPHR